MCKSRDEVPHVVRRQRPGDESANERRPFNLRDLRIAPQVTSRRERARRRTQSRRRQTPRRYAEKRRATKHFIFCAESEIKLKMENKNKKYNDNDSVTGSLA
uniref:Uncharacterized protein n=1 Tax=Human betaherpesvirus 6A TaxID=32603 RepID=A0A2L2Q9H8_9BETA|nr:hypothetical protein [Human betaherpesvirus 6A]